MRKKKMNKKSVRMTGWWLARAELWFKRFSQNSARDMLIFQARKAGKTFREIGLEYGLSGTRVSQIYNKADRAEMAHKYLLEYLGKPFEEQLEDERFSLEQKKEIYLEFRKYLIP
tara:strand:- start:1456 stop:1800 length:345 start_codon:yes stop_codon:yes gene_type:complete